MPSGNGITAQSVNRRRATGETLTGKGRPTVPVPQRDELRCRDGFGNAIRIIERVFVAADLNAIHAKIDIAQRLLLAGHGRSLAETCGRVTNAPAIIGPTTT